MRKVAACLAVRGPTPPGPNDGGKIKSDASSRRENAAFGGKESREISGVCAVGFAARVGWSSKRCCCVAAPCRVVESIGRKVEVID